MWAQSRVLDLINEWDEDGSRSLSRKEFHKVVMFMGKEHLTRGETAKIFKSFDEDGTGSIDFGELERLIAKFSLATRGEWSAHNSHASQSGSHVCTQSTPAC